MPQDSIVKLRDLQIAYEREGTAFGVTMARWCQDEIDWYVAQRRCKKIAA